MLFPILMSRRLGMWRGYIEKTIIPTPVNN